MSFRKGSFNLIKVSDDLIEQPQTLHPLVVGLQLHVELREVADGGEHDGHALARLVVELVVASLASQKVSSYVLRQDVVEEATIVGLQFLHLLLLLCGLGGKVSWKPVISREPDVLSYRVRLCKTISVLDGSAILFTGGQVSNRCADGEENVSEVSVVRCYPLVFFGVFCTCNFHRKSRRAVDSTCCACRYNARTKTVRITGVMTRRDTLVTTNGLQRD